MVTTLILQSYSWRALEYIDYYNNDRIKVKLKGLTPVEYQNNADPHTRELVFEKMLKEIMLQRCKDELELYKLFAQDPAFKAS